MHQIEIEFRSKPRGIEKLIKEHGFIQVGSKANASDFKDFSLPQQHSPILYFEYGYTLNRHIPIDPDLDWVNAILRIHLDQSNGEHIKLVYGLVRRIMRRYYCSGVDSSTGFIFNSRSIEIEYE